MIVNEIFYSIQGEGSLAGTPSVFIRLAGCPLRCKYCDTKYAWDVSAGRQYDIDQIIKQVNSFNCDFVVITGGEPMTNNSLPSLLDLLKKIKKHITIETAGIKFIPNLNCDLMSISPKLSNSIPLDPDLTDTHNRNRLDVTAAKNLLKNYNCQLKFVVDSADDLPEIKKFLSEIGTIDPKIIMLMPQAATRNQYLANSPIVAQLCLENNLRFCPRLQTLLWNNKKGK